MALTVTAFPPVTIVWVAAGGAIGSALRFAIGEWIRRVPALAGFPWSTLLVNVTGSFVLGAVAGWVLTGTQVAPEHRAFLMIGVLGGYTTFSTFAFEGLEMLQTGQWGRLIVYAMASVALAVGAAAAGFALTQG
jgi:CrcB protein